MIKDLERDETDATARVLYVIAHPHGYYKIGVSSNPLRRIQDLQTASPYSLRLIGFSGFKDPVAAESALHSRFSECHERGEWFDFSDKVATTLVNNGGQGLRSVVAEQTDYEPEVKI